MYQPTFCTTPQRNYCTHSRPICIFFQSIVCSASFTHRLRRGIYSSLLHHVRQFVSNDGIPNQCSWPILSWSEGNVLSYSKSSCIEALSESSRPGIRLHLPLREVYSETLFHRCYHR